jgi:DNA-binding transcriptional MerR regulator
MSLPARQRQVSVEYGIGDLARVAGTNVQTVRFYEAEGLIRPPARTAGNQRRYTQADLERLKFIRHARELGFPLDDVRSLLELAAHPEKPCTEADAIAKMQLQEVDRKIIRLKSLRRALTAMLESCQQGEVRTCRIIETLADHELCGSDHRAGSTSTSKPGRTRNQTER